MKRPKNYKKRIQNFTDKILDFIYDYFQAPYYRARRKIYYAKENFLDWYVFEYKDAGVYYYYSSTDCDLCTREGYNRVRSQKAYERERLNMYECAEGPTTIKKCARGDYFQYFREGGTVTDHILEAFENGDGNKVIISNKY